MARAERKTQKKETRRNVPQVRHTINAMDTYKARRKKMKRETTNTEKRALNRMKCKAENDSFVEYIIMGVDK